MSSLIMRAKRNANHAGNPQTSEELKRPFLALIGKEYNSVFCTRVGLPYNKIQAWLNCSNILSDQLQDQVRAVIRDHTK